MINYLATQKNWQNAFSDIITDFGELAELLALNPQDFDQQYGSFPLKVPRGFVQKMQKGDINDPLLRQVLPTFAETVQVTGFVTDPLEENTSNPVKGVIHKYASRVLLPVTGACMVHCRYCFRQHFDYHENLPSGEDWQTIRDYIQADSRINEVILSGGDPLSLSDRRLSDIFAKIEAIPQIQTIRLHTRVPVVIAERLDTILLERLQASRCKIVMVIHVNHPNEIDEATAFYLNRARLAGITMLNQTVLLKGINDDADILAKLSDRLWQAGVLPYYLHVLDKVAGASHFLLEDEQAVAIHRQLLAKCAGYLVPKLVREMPQVAYKMPIQ
ncbi:MULTISPECIES: EF-P beta-lysylation protein EpmB [unclassified Moraxella]|uniref:EF-P beta-lysylation protein EpmB n=1 Tax=unclassified Moraxella TaxID=2685852 RepID=UPI003AF87A1A